VVIPADIRRALGLTEGSTLIAVLEDDGRLVLEDRQRMLTRLRGSWRDLAAGRDPVGELAAERAAEAALEDAEATGDARAVARAHEAIAGIGKRT
jgi:AbrB family looped-hinge helix DNA binding protein